MKYQYNFKFIACIFAATLMLPASVFAAKGKFERTKPHINVGTAITQRSRILIYMEDISSANIPTCNFFGQLIVSDITSDSEPKNVIVVEDIELGADESIAVPIPSPSNAEELEELREYSVEIVETGNPPAPCPLMVSAVGYKSENQATEYYIDAPAKSRWYKFPVPLEDSPNLGDTPIFGVLLGFVGGNGGQSVRVVLEDLTYQNNSQSKQCDFSGVLWMRSVPLLGQDAEDVVQLESPINFQQGRAILDSDFNEFGADSHTRIDAVAGIKLNKPLKNGNCANFIDISMRIIKSETGETQAAKKVGYRPQFYIR